MIQKDSPFNSYVKAQAQALIRRKAQVDVKEVYK